MLTLSYDERKGMILGVKRSRGDERYEREEVTEREGGEGWILEGIRFKRGWISEDEKGERDVILDTCQIS